MREIFNKPIKNVPKILCCTTFYSDRVCYHDNKLYYVVFMYLLKVNRLTFN